MTQWNSSDLAEPPALAKDTLRVVPLGGLGCLLYTSDAADE